MWHFISEQISQALNCDFICDDIRSVNGGDSHQAFRISDGKRRFFVKVNEHGKLPLLHAEAQGLGLLQQAEDFRVPKVICLGQSTAQCFLVMEYIALTQGTEDAWFASGQALARMHQNHQQGQYGWQDDNYIGATLQANRWNSKWHRFFAEQRIGYLLQLLAEQGHSWADADTYVPTVERLLTNHQPDACLLHGDLWQGNTGFYKQQPVLFDPAVYYGDRETDLAMTEFFGRFPQPFYQGYEATWPMSEGYAYRKPVYQLYHLLNHALMFGGQYLQNAQLKLRQLAA